MARGGLGGDGRGRRLKSGWMDRHSLLRPLFLLLQCRICLTQTDPRRVAWNSPCRRALNIEASVRAGVGLRKQQDAPESSERAARACPSPPFIWPSPALIIGTSSAADQVRTEGSVTEGER